MMVPSKFRLVGGRGGVKTENRYLLLDFRTRHVEKLQAPQTPRFSNR